MEYEDISYLTSKLYPNLDLEQTRQPMDQVEKEPFLYMLLLAASLIPLVFHKNHQTVFCFAEYEDDSFYTDGLDRHFKIAYAEGIYRLALKRWSEFPHFANAYYDEHKQVLALSAMTDRAFQKLVDALVDCDYDLDEEPDFRVNPAMLTFVTDLFKKKIFLHDYEKTFSTETETQTQGLDRMNEALQQLIPFVNEGGNPDFNRIARETGTSAEELRELFLELKKKVGR